MQDLMASRWWLLSVAAALAVIAAVVATADGDAASATGTFANTARIYVGDAQNTCHDGRTADDVPGVATDYPSEISVTGLAGAITDVNVTLTGIYGYPEEIGVLLVGPSGEETVLMTDSGGDVTLSWDDQPAPVNVTFDDAAAIPLPDSLDEPGLDSSHKLQNGTYKPTLGISPGAWCFAPSSFPAPAPAGPYQASLSVFNGTNPNGTWSLYVIDDYTGATALESSIVGGWSLDITTAHNFTGFHQPVDRLPTMNSVQAGQGIPVKFGLGGGQGLDVLASGYPQSQQIACDSTEPTDVIEETVTAGSSGLSYDAATDTYRYVWKTNKAWANTCRQFVLGLNDGTFHSANFKFTK